MYQTLNIIVKSNQEKLYDYCKESCNLAKQMKNATLFRCRQILSANNKDFNELTNNELEVLQEFHLVSDKQNGKKLYLPSYETMDKVFKDTKNPDYYNNLSMQSTQGIISTVLKSFNSFFESLSSYKANPEAFTGKPNMPGYVKGNQCSFTITNQDAVIKVNKKGEQYLKLPKTKAVVMLGCTMNGRLKSVVIQPLYDTYKINIVMEDQNIVPTYCNNDRILGLDLGVNNFAASNNNCGLIPFIINGRVLKSYNQWYNKELAMLRSFATKEGSFTTKRIQKLNKNHYNKTTDFYNKAASYIVKYCIENKINTIVVGKNDFWKQDVNMGKQNNQEFCFIAHARFIKKLELLATKYGIQVVATEESYTSKASLLDFDEMTTGTEFSGNRVKRGLYKAGDICLNADVNGAGNIIRKVFTDAFGSVKDMSYMYKTVNVVQVV